MTKPDLKVDRRRAGAAAEPAEPHVPEPHEQAEMPFAVVDGEPVTQMPKDLYIPPDALQVFLEAFEGPLDLLLYLIRRQNLDILDIPIAEITRQYMSYIDVMRGMQLELAGEYLVMAATLAEIKSRMLLPRPAAARRRGGRSARRTRAPPAGIRALQARGAGHRGAASHRSRHVPGVGRAGRAPRREAAAERHAAGDARRVEGRDVARRDVRAPSHQPRAAVGAPAHVRSAGHDAHAGVRRVRAAVPRRGRAHGRHRHFHRDPRAAARGADRDRAVRTLCADPRARRCSAPRDRSTVEQRPGRATARRAPNHDRNIP